VIDASENLELPKNFRTSSFFPKSNPNIKEPNLEGLPELHMAGSGQFTEAQLINALEYMPADKVVIVDLRKESHGFVNGTPVTWYISRNALNANRTPEQVIKFENELIGNLKQQESITIHKLEKIKDLPNPPKITYVEPKNVKPDLVEKEQELVKRHNLKYVRFFIQDHNAPDPGQVDAFINLVKNLPNDSWLYFHCRAGRGRTTMFMTMYDILKNAPKISLDEIITRQAYLGGKMLTELPAGKDNWKYEPIKDRLNFINLFYDFVSKTKGQEGLRWSDWLESNKPVNKI